MGSRAPVLFVLTPFSHGVREQFLDSLSSLYHLCSRNGNRGARLSEFFTTALPPRRDEAERAGLGVLLRATAGRGAALNASVLPEHCGRPPGGRVRGEAIQGPEPLRSGREERRKHRRFGPATSGSPRFARDDGVVATAARQLRAEPKRSASSCKASIPEPKWKRAEGALKPARSVSSLRATPGSKSPGGSNPGAAALPFGRGEAQASNGWPRALGIATLRSR